MMKYDFKTTLYDLFGYVLPGVFLIIILWRVCILTEGYTSYSDIHQIIAEAKVYTVLCFLALSYIAGHFIGSLSSWILEKGICQSIARFKRQFKVETLLPNFHAIIVKEFASQFSVDFDDSSIPIMITLVEERMPRAYSTAFIFLSMYGMARNFSLLFFIAFCIEIILAINGNGVYAIALLYLIPSSVLFFRYIKFRKHFIEKICYSYLTCRMN